MTVARSLAALLLLGSSPVWADEPVVLPAALATKTDLDPAIVGEIARLQQQLDQQKAELAELRTTQEMASVAAAEPEEPKFVLSGFIDMGLQKVWVTDPKGFATTASTFVLGNVNLYFSFRPAAHWRALTEVRFTNFPSTESEVADPANGIGDDTTRWGAIVLERAYIEYDHSSALGLRVGQFLTPFGIWNVDHGSPTVIPIVRPESMTTEMFPKHQLGIEVFGERSGLLPGRWSVEYHAYLTNGRTATDVDPTDDKMVGTRLVVSTTRPQRMAFGVSAMIGRNHGIDHLVDGGKLADNVDEASYREVGVAVDAAVDAGGLRLRGEFTLHHINYAQSQYLVGGMTLLTPDRRDLDGWALAAYRIPRSRFEPYVYTEAFRQREDTGDLQLMGAAGVNVYFTAAIQLKVEYLYARQFDTGDLKVDAGQEREQFLGAKLVMGL